MLSTLQRFAAMVVVVAVAGCGASGSQTPPTQTTATTQYPSSAVDVPGATGTAEATTPTETSAGPDVVTSPTTPTPKPKRQAKPHVSLSFFEAMDNDAVALDDAIGQALDGEPGAEATIAKLRGRIVKRVNRRFLRGIDPSVGTNAIVSAATSAREAARAGNLRRLVEARVDLQDAREKLTKETIGG